MLIQCLLSFQASMPNSLFSLDCDAILFLMSLRHLCMWKLIFWILICWNRHQTWMLQYSTRVMQPHGRDGSEAPPWVQPPVPTELITVDVFSTGSVQQEPELSPWQTKKAFIRLHGFLKVQSSLWIILHRINFDVIWQHLKTMEEGCSCNLRLKQIIGAEFFQIHFQLDRWCRG